MERLTESRPKQYCITDIEEIWVEYNRNTDTLYIYFSSKNVEPEEAVLVGENIVVGLKDGNIISITINEFSKVIGLEE